MTLLSEAKALRELAEKATPGPYYIELDKEKQPHAMHGKAVGIEPSKIVDCLWGSATKRGKAQYKYFAACSPELIKRLCDAVIAQALPVPPDEKGK